MWTECDGLDHVPIQITIDANGYQGTHEEVQRGSTIDVDKLIDLTDEQANRLYLRVKHQCNQETDDITST